MAHTSEPTIPPLLNRLMKVILRSPLHRLVSKRLMLITFIGRKSGKRYTTPVSYLREGDRVTGFTHGAWWKNLRGGAPVTLHIQGKDIAGVAKPTAEDKQAVVAGLRAFLRQASGDARFYGVTLDASGEPDPDQVARAAEDAVMLRIYLN